MRITPEPVLFSFQSTWWLNSKIYFTSLRAHFTIPILWSFSSGEAMIRLISSAILIYRSRISRACQQNALKLERCCVHVQSVSFSILRRLSACVWTLQHWTFIVELNFSGFTFISLTNRNQFCSWQHQNFIPVAGTLSVGSVALVCQRIVNISRSTVANPITIIISWKC